MVHKINFGRFDFVHSESLLWFGMFSLVGLVWFGRFGLVFGQWVWLGMFGLDWYV